MRQRRRARAALTLCAQCRHKYAIYASVWASPPPLPPVSRDRAHVHARAGEGCTRARGAGEDVWVSFARYPRDRAPLYCTWSYVSSRHAVLSSPPDSFLPSHRLPSTLNRYPSLPFPSTLPSIHPLLSSGLNCCNLWPMPVDLTVELSHGDLYGLLILQRSSGGCGTWPWVFIDFQRATNYHHHQGG